MVVHDLAHNAADLVFIAGNSPIVSILDELDRRTENIEDNETLCNGPFHVFQASDMQSPTRSNTGSDVLDLELWGPGLASLETLGRDEGSSPQLPRTPELLTLGDAILSSDSFDFDVDLLCPPSPGAIAQPLVSIASPSQSCGLDLEDFTMPVAKMLLDHYRNHMVTFFTPARVEAKSPWEAIYIPSLLSTVGEIGLTGDSSNAKVSLLFAVFAISAFSLDGRSPAEGNEGQDWSALGELYRDRATRRLKRSLSDLSLSQGKKEKYKDILMALLSMVTICVSVERS